MLNGETEAGVSVHWIDEGIDTGSIIVQKRYRLKDKDTLFSVYSTLFGLSCKAISEAIDIIATDANSGSRQSGRNDGAFGFPSKSDIERFRRLGRKTV